MMNDHYYNVKMAIMNCYLLIVDELIFGVYTTAYTFLQSVGE